MTLQPRPHNSIEKRKQDVRKYSRNAVVSVAGGIGVGVIGALLFVNNSAWLLLGMVIAVVGGLYNWNKVRKIVNHKDNY